MMIDRTINPYETALYSIQWRLHVTNGWQRLMSEEDFGAAVAAADDLRETYGGQTRIVSQGVVHADGMGAREFIPDPIRNAADAAALSREQQS